MYYYLVHMSRPDANEGNGPKGFNGRPTGYGNALGCVSWTLWDRTPITPLRCEIPAFALWGLYPPRVWKLRPPGRNGPDLAVYFRRPALGHAASDGRMAAG